MKVLTGKNFFLVGAYKKMYQKYPLGLFLKLVYLPAQMLLYYFLWRNILGNTKEEVINLFFYYLFSLILMYAFPFVHIANDIQIDVIEGNIVNYLVRPIPYYRTFISRYIAWMLCYSVVFVPSVVIMLVRGTALLNVVFFVIHVLFGCAIEFLIWYNVGLSALIFEKNRGLSMVVTVVRTVASGSLLPLYIFPGYMQMIFKLLPFHLYIYTPVQSLLYGEKISDFFCDVIKAILWMNILMFGAIAQWRKGLRKMQVNIS